MRCLNTALLALILLIGTIQASEKIAPTPAPKIQIAILLDTSGSMSGLIQQAKAHLWGVVNEFATAKRDGKQALLEVALYEYGKSSLSSKEGYLRQIVPLTDDLDKISEELFALKTNGGEEYCGWVIQDATRNLQWSKNNRDIKTIFIAGNEPFSQGPVNYVSACQNAIGRSIVVNTIHCGSDAAGISGKWKHGAMLADGTYTVLNHNQAIANIKAPQDKRIAELNTELNKTYIAYGAKGQEKLKRQAAQDSNAAGLSSTVIANRAMAKSSVQYRNSSWDLVDAAKDKDIERIAEEALPENMKKMTMEERKTYVKEAAAKRSKIQAELKKLVAARARFVAEETKRAGKEDKSIDKMINLSIRKQAEKKGYQLEK